MLLEKEQVEVGRRVRNLKNQWRENADASYFSLTVLIVLLHKYSSRLYSEIQINIQTVETPIRKKELRYSPEDDQTFYSIFQTIKRDLLPALDGHLGSLDVEWITDAEQLGLKNRIRLTPSHKENFYSAVFSSDPHSFFHALFRKAARHYAVLAEHALTMPNIPIADLEYYSDPDVKEIDSFAYGPVDGKISAPEFIDEIFEKTVNEYPNRIAVNGDGKSITYLQLEKKINRMASTLTKLGVSHGDVVGILLDRSLENYVAMIAIMKCGGAYVPIDPDYPSERVRYILEDSSAQFLISESSFASNYATYTGDVLNTDIELMAALSGSDGETPESSFKRSATDTAYIIYTSGSTGQPKGVVISHAAASNLIKAEKAIFNIQPTDKIAQGFSTAFDASIEEIWLAFASGAALYPVDKDVMRSGVDLSEFLIREKITVFSTVPTLLSVMYAPLPSLRLLILGGEACSSELLQRWFTKKLRVVNTYGPTEATVIATVADCGPTKKNTIGKPIHNCAVFVVDSSLKPVPAGVPGELCIAGGGLASGYQNRPELTEEKFVNASFNVRQNFRKKIYRSGDLARVNEEGDVEFLGRIDSQIKLRGYRIELAEIESQMLSLPNIKNAAVTVRKESLTGDLLVAYVVLEDQSQTFNVNVIKQSLQKRLASYMIPAAFVQLDKFPLLASGKIDRKKLDAIGMEVPRKETLPTEPLNEAEHRIFDVWKKYFSREEISKKDDFFLDLGGHSMLAAKTVSELRQQLGFERLSVLDVYKNSTIEKLARQFASKRKARNKSYHGREESNTEPKTAKARHFGCGVAQFFSFYFVFSFNLLRDLPLYGVFFYLFSTGHSLLTAIGWGLASSIVSYPLAIALAVGAKWALLGRIKAGSYRLWSGFYLRWWFVRKLFQIVDLYHLAGTPLLPAVYRALGMKIGKDVHLETDHFAAFDLISIGDGTSIDEGATVNGYVVKDGCLILGSIEIGANCFVGTRAVVCENTIMGDGARLEDLSLVASGTKIPSGETWSGSPSRCTSKINCAEVINPPVFSKFYKLGVSLLYCFLFSIIPVVAAIAFVPGIFLLMQFDPVKEFWLYLPLLPVVGASFVVLLAAEVVILKWILVGQVKPGIYPVHGWFYIRNWIVDQLLRISLDHVGQLHATLYVASWYRLLGMKIAKHVELSTAASSTPDLVQLDEGCTIADEVSLGSPHVEKGWMSLAPLRMGFRSFAGNSAVIPSGTKMADHSLVGVLSVAPKREDAMKTGATWFGSPAILFPKREDSNGYSEERTYKPSRRLRIKRGAFELLRVTLPPAAFTLVMSLVINVGLILFQELGTIKTIVILPIVFGACCTVLVGMVAIIKWAVMGRYKPFSKPLWTNFVWRLEFVNALYEFFSSPLLLHLLQGTPFLVWYLRLMGAKIGNCCYVDTTGFLEWDLVKIGDEVVINENAVMQTHLFEDRVLKASYVTVGDCCTIGTTSVVLYDSEMKEGSHLGDLSLLMKGEMLPEETQWVGIPAIDVATLKARQTHGKQRVGRQWFRHESIAS